MGVQFGVRGRRSTGPAFHVAGGAAVCRTLGLDPLGDQMRGRELLARVERALRPAAEGSGRRDCGLERRLRELRELAASAGDLGIVWWG